MIAAWQHRHQPLPPPPPSTLTEDKREIERRQREIAETLAVVRAYLTSVTHHRPEGRRGT